MIDSLENIKTRELFYDPLGYLPFEKLQQSIVISYIITALTKAGTLPKNKEQLRSMVDNAASI